MKLSEKYLDRISHSTEFSKPVVLTKNVKLYGDMCRLEGEMHQLAMAKGRAIEKSEEEMLEIAWKRLGAELIKIAEEKNL